MTTITEVWKPIAGYENRYFISNKGNVLSVFCGKKKYLAASKHRNGYFQVSLTKNGKSKSFLIHRLVADSFLEKQEGRVYVNHKDYNKRNNDACNLEWCTCKENVNHSTIHMHGHKTRITNTGEHHISKEKNGSYRVSVGGRDNRCRKAFRSLNDAVLYRDEMLGV